MELQVGLWNKDWAAFLKSWITILLSLHLQFYQVAGCPQECRCDKIFLYCNDRSLTSVPLGIQEGYKILYLHNNQINNAGFPLELHHVASVETVFLYGNQLDEFPLNLPRNVRVLHLQENNIQTISRAALAQLSRLEELHLDDNSISTVGVEEGAFREAVSLQLLFLTKNHLSSVPIGLPAGLRELRLDENRIAVVAGEAFHNVTRLERLLLDGNLLTDEGLAPGTFQDLVNLRELSLARNSLTTPPPLLPGDFLVRLYLQDNQMNEIPVTAFSNLRQLERLDISNNQLQSLTQGVFDGLVSLRQLTVRNNLWVCDCSVRWVIAWLRSLPATLNVRGFMCHRPERVRGMVIRELSLDAIQCPRTTVPGPTLPLNDPSPSATTVTTTLPLPDLPSTMPTFPTLTPPTMENIPRTDLPLPPYQDPLQIAFNFVNGTFVQVSWASAFPVAAYRISWVKLGHNLAGGITRERTVGGECQELDLANLEPKSTYRVCVHVLDALNAYRPGDDAVCSEVTTKSATFRGGGGGSRAGGPEQATQQDANSPLLLASLIGGAVLLVLVVLLSIFCWHMHKAGRSSSTSKWKYNRGRRKDDYCEAGTKKDNSILEMTETSFQIVSLNNEQLLKGDFRIQPIYTPNGGIGFRDCHLSNNSTPYCKSNVPNVDFCHT
ncbi:leucine-rich repeat transmembrane protein FLRT2 [Scleropages formosus]|uniref:Fibronectin leucine rich transmembrane protein 2 n=1 Tax=Scleropages formosus TaxID=113540 RepID=A0A8C9R6I3_SCLFO|nr:leucine-rich repeat transmembrane protein FLRT2 [Scleropages formosus]XP_029114204.1 leucine-rich repeat transmembrane protein FLRT2 [Scleropages formosus]